MNGVTIPLFFIYGALLVLCMAQFGTCCALQNIDRHVAEIARKP